MTLGLPAYFKDRKTLSLNSNETKVLALSILAEFGWTEIGLHPFAIDYKTTGGVMTTGERFYVNVTDTEIILRSECLNRAQFLDFGKNKYNVEKFWLAYDERLKA